MKRFYGRFRIILLTLALGLASVQFFRAVHERWTRVAVDVPAIESEAPLLVRPVKTTDFPTLTGGRDLSLYEYLGDYPVCGDDRSGRAQCEAALRKGRRLIWKNWKAGKRSYLTRTSISVDPELSPTGVIRQTCLFLEPGENGRFRAVVREAKVGDVFRNLINEIELKSLEYFAPGRDSELIFSDYEKEASYTF
ncbi:MAG: hypothetical protein JSS81_28865 [Acidobacteria bacterium]|nr:hypothetical protein [Acidobacteriota bacterium]